MRSLSAPLKAHIETGATTLCRIWTLTRKDGVVFGFTGYERRRYKQLSWFRD